MSDEVPDQLLGSQQELRLGEELFQLNVKLLDELGHGERQSKLVDDDLCGGGDLLAHSHHLDLPGVLLLVWRADVLEGAGVDVLGVQEEVVHVEDHVAGAPVLWRRHEVKRG